MFYAVFNGFLNSWVLGNISNNRKCFITQVPETAHQGSFIRSVLTVVQYEVESCHFRLQPILTLARCNVIQCLMVFLWESTDQLTNKSVMYVDVHGKIYMLNLSVSLQVCLSLSASLCVSLSQSLAVQSDLNNIVAVSGWWRRQCVAGFCCTNDENPPNQDITIILEGTKILTSLQNFPRTYVMLVVFAYALNLADPKKLRYTFKVFQKILPQMGYSMLFPKVNSLKNKLLV